MTKQNVSVQEIRILDELVNNAIGLPLESQNLLLLMAKGMSYTKSCLLGGILLQKRKNNR